MILDFSLNESADPVEGYLIGLIGLKNVPSLMAKFQIPTLISFGLENYYHLRVVGFH